MFNYLIRTFSLLFVFSVISPAAEAQPGEVFVSCDGGQSYRLRAHAVAIDGEIVTGYWLTGSAAARHHMRLIPMGDGYRYSGTGIWLDGVREDATLNFGPHRSVACKVEENK